LSCHDVLRHVVSPLNMLRHVVSRHVVSRYACLVTLISSFS
jgi:hypothetical protein